MASDFHTGQRVSFSGVLCTVRYVGTIEGTKGEWLGVEWDDPSRGKHSGEHNGIIYFRCRSRAPTAGSFVRRSRPVDKPLSFLEALHGKYASDTHGGSDKVIKIGGKVVEEVGFDKIRKQMAMLQELRIVLLDGMCIAGVLADSRNRNLDPRTRAMDVIRDTCPKVVDLDLSRNLFERWEEVADICGAIHNVQSLKVDGNMFTELIEPGREEHFETAFNGIQELGLDDTFLSWIEITALSNCFSSLRSLSASSNDFVSLGVHEPPSSLTSLTLERNKFTSLQALSPVAGLRNLRTLSLKYNFISSILKDEKSVTAGSVIGKLEFSDSLTYIDLSYNSIGSWSFINEMEKVFPSLSGLRLSHNPLYESGKTANGDAMGLDEGFMLTLARLGNLRQLNFSNITQQERTNAEMYYLSRIAKELAAVPEKEEESITAQHKRYAELSELYGPPIITRVTPSTINPNSLEARLITFKFYQNLPQTSSLNTAETTTHTKEVPRGFDVYRLKGMVGKLFRQRPMGLKLVWETGEWDPVAGAHKDDWDSSDEETEEDGTDERGKWIRREVELEDGTRELGFWVDGREATVRVELR